MLPGNTRGHGNVNANEITLHREISQLIGRQTFQFSYQSLKFELISNLPSLVGITVGAQCAFGLGADSQAYEIHRGGGATGWGLMAHVQAGGNGVWAIGPTPTFIYRFEVISGISNNLRGNPPALASISVGTGGGVWGLDSSGKVYGLVTP